MNAPAPAAAASASGPLLSVVVPVHDAAAFLPRTLDALLAQTYRPVEIILSDDGSRDGSLDICRRYERSRPDVFRVVSGPQAGVSVARNRALALARGEWLGFCDADDVPHPDLYARLHGMAARDRADLALCAFRWVNPGGKTDGPGLCFPAQGNGVLEGRRQIDAAYFHPLLRLDWNVRSCLFAALFRRDLVEKPPPVRFVPRIRLCEDAVFMLDCLLRVRRISTTDEILYDYVQHGDNSCVRHKRASEWIRLANDCRLSRERYRIFAAWSAGRRHPLERLKFALRAWDRARRCRAFRRARRPLSPESPAP